MELRRVRPHNFRLSALLGLVALPAWLAGCGGDDDPLDPGPPGPDLSLIAAPLADAAQSLVTLNDAHDALTGLSGSIGGVMGPGGFSTAPAGAPSLDIAPGGGAAASSILPVLGELARAMAEPSEGPGSVRLTLQPPLVLGVTCIWGIAADSYVGDGGENSFGTPRQDETFFELYAPGGNGKPALPLQPIGGFSSVRPLSQGSVLDVEIFTGRDGQTVLDFVTQGTFSGSNTFDIQVGGESTGEDGTSVLQFDVDLTPSVLRTNASVLDILLDENLSLTANGGTLVLAVDKTGTGAASLVFTIDFDPESPFPISSGTVTLDGTTVATISGSSLANPVITLSEGSPLSSSDRSVLAAIFDDADTLTGGVLDLVLIGSCIGTESREFCGLLPQESQQG